MKTRWRSGFVIHWSSMIAVPHTEVNMNRSVLSFSLVVSLVLAMAACVAPPATSPSPNPAEDPTELPPGVVTPVPEVPTPIPTEAPTPLPSAHVAILGTICDLVGCNADTLERPEDGMVMVYAPAGEFEMGNADGADDAQPVHTVALDGFWIDSTEVTYAQYQHCEEAGDCERPAAVTAYADWDHYDNGNYGEHPIWKVDWQHAVTYCAWAEGRLPTEAEWEYVARGPEGYTYPWGDDEPDCDKANFRAGAGFCVADSSPVGSHPAGASWCGAQDMAGNVSEWVADWYAADYYATPLSTDPAGPSSGSQRVVRGGGETTRKVGIRGYTRQSLPFDVQGPATGFRCAMDVE